MLRQLVKPAAVTSLPQRRAPAPARTTAGQVGLRGAERAAPAAATARPAGEADDRAAEPASTTTATPATPSHPRKSAPRAAAAGHGRAAAAKIDAGGWEEF
jgi:hypothetical protein